MLFYSDPFKDNPYGRLQGEMSSVWCTFEFSEAKLYHHEDSYVLAANFTKLENVVRSYKPEQTIDLPVKAVWTIHNKDYQVRKKNDQGKYENQTYKASIHEKLLYQHITDNPNQWLEEGKAIKGKITHLNNGSYEMQGNNHQLPINSFQIEQIPLSGTLPDWTPPKSKGSWSGGNNGGVSLDEKVKFLRKELLDTMHNDRLKKQFVESAPPISTLLWEVVQQYDQNEMFLASYVDLLKSLVS